MGSVICSSCGPEDIARTLAGKKVTAVRGDGKYIHFDLKPKAHFAIAEMDGRILFHEKGAELPAKHQLVVRFTEGAALTATVGLWGVFGVGGAVPVEAQGALGACYTHATSADPTC